MYMGLYPEAGERLSESLCRLHLEDLEPRAGAGLHHRKELKHGTKE